MSNSQEPTSATAGHAATAAPTGPCPSPWATLAASVPAMPRPSSHRASTGTDVSRAASNTIEPAQISPSTLSGINVSRPAGLTVCPHEIVGVFVGRHRGHRRDAMA